MFEQAARMKLRFDTPKGQLSVEDLWQLPLTSNNGANLDDIAIKLDKELRETSKVSFVNKEKTVNNTSELKLDIVKHIINTRLAEQEKEKNARELKAKRQQVDEILHRKDTAALEGMTREELLKLRAELG